DPNPRLGIPSARRTLLTGATAFGTGLFLGFSSGNRMSAYRFRAENAHRQPKSSLEWWHYSKTRRYYGIVAGTKEGFRMGSKLAVGASIFSLLEWTVDQARHDQQDFVSTVVAGLSLSGIHSLWARHDMFTAARTAKISLKASLTYGLLQDALAYYRGFPPHYVHFIMG
ncbi:uncharacterized protein BO97DRAFT_308842, partial [Aspergillus homomorphus CBS 101889]